MGNANEGSSMTQISAAARGNPAPVTQIDHARAGTVTPAMRTVAEKEGRDPEFIREGVAAGRIAIPANIHHASLSPEGVGGGLRSVEDVRHILSMGADKVAINTAAIKRPELITEVANAFGSQCMVLSIQAKRNRTWPGKWEAYYDNGRAHSGYDVVEWAKRGVALGAGEILLTSVDNEGLQQGMDLELIEAVTKAVNVPVICGGGVGCGDDIVDAANAGADAVACAAVLHYKKETVTELKEDIRAGGVEVRQV
mgnify:CR=1 FL=1